MPGRRGACARPLDPAADAYAGDLWEFAELRNAIVHDRSGGRVIAEPNDEAVNAIGRIADLLRRPPQVGAPFAKRLATLTVARPVADVVSLMYNETFTQVPSTTATASRRCSPRTS